MTNENQQKTGLLNKLLSKVQKETVAGEYIYGITDNSSKNIFIRLNDFFIDKSGVPPREKTYFYELLATLLKAGIPLNSALKILTTKTGNPRLRRIIATLSYELEHGRPLSSALERFPEVFEETERGAIKSAEAIGNLENMLFKIATNLNNRNELAMKFKGALIYPMAVLAALAIGIVVMLIFVVPKIQAIFAESALALPLSTRVLLTSSVFLTKFWWLLAILIIFAATGIHLYVNSDQGRFIWDFKKLRIPFIGVMLRKIYVLRFVDTLGVLIESGLPINKALEFTAGAIGNEVYRVKTYEALGRVQEGQKLSVALSNAPFLFPETITNMLAVGERAASLGDISQKIGAHFEREIDHTLRNMTTIAGPIFILVIGVSVAFFALAVLSPIFSLTQAVQ